jgi:quercetin dioxygenase-like cupin family protein
LYGPGEGEHLWFLGALVTIRVPGESVNGEFALIEFLMSRHTSPPRHHHPQDETFILLDGRLTFIGGEQRFECEAGATWVVPRGVIHTFRVESETARLLVVSTPAGLDRLFRDGGVPASTAALPPADAPAQSVEAIEQILRDHRHDNVGPPMGRDD